MNLNLWGKLYLLLKQSKQCSITLFLANEIGDSGASALSNGMRVNKTLTKLYLQGPNKQRTKMDHME